MQAPTDNLYKFLAITGMLCFVFFFFDLNKRADELESKIDAATMQQAEFKATLENLTDSADQITKEINELMAGKPTLEELEEAQKELLVFREKIKVKFADLKVVNARLNVSIDLLKDYYEKLKDLSRFYGYLQFCSLIVSIIGALLWYFRTQRYLDLKDKQSANSLGPVAKATTQAGTIQDGKG
ncbi:hypothetical protein BK673_01820 [Pseudomonas fluorescens]|jgi:Ca2+/Na+ antiporter|uniref:Uncharacterized protein n=1 Tax=Pseudomonas fluorescens TaxID=294 RepID=A0A423PD68_PSEFL|nr:hypothetical protein [Pseudomonas fluorescens]ROO13837.1 hypothetical protein BK673_01820 [Pseudomonas fluorescens]